MDKKCDVDHGNRFAVRSEAGVATETEAVQSTVDGLHRTISVEEGESLQVTLDESRTNNKSLCGRVCDLWLIRKVIDFFRELFGLEEVIDSASKGKSEKNILRKSSVSPEKCVKEADLLLKDIDALTGELLAYNQGYSTPWKARKSVKKFSLRLDRLIKMAKGKVGLDKKIVKIENSIKWLKHHLEEFYQK